MFANSANFNQSSFHQTTFSHGNYIKRIEINRKSFKSDALLTEFFFFSLQKRNCTKLCFEQCNIENVINKQARTVMLFENYIRYMFCVDGYKANKKIFFCQKLRYKRIFIVSKTRRQLFARFCTYNLTKHINQVRDLL